METANYIASFGNTLLNGVFQYDKDGNFIRVDQTTTTTKAVTTTSTTAVIMLRCDRNSASDPIPNCQFEVGNTATAYEPYQADIHTTNLPETVYGGSLDVVNGVLTVDRAMVDMGTLDWRYNGAIPNGNQYAVGITDKAVGETNFICSSYMTGTHQLTIGYICGRASSTTIACNALESTANDFIASVSGQQLVYELAEPRTIQLDPQTINTLVGVNNVWGDAGEVEVTYKADVQLYIGKLIGTTEDDYIADTAIPNGAVFSIGDRVFKATATIARGETIVPGTNCTETSITEQINSLYALV